MSGFQIPADAPKGNKPIQLYSLGTPNGQKVGIMLDECALEFDDNVVDIFSREQFTDWFKTINPNSKIPALVDLNGPDNKPICIWESAAILIYLAEKTGKFLPKTGAERYAVLQWLEFQIGSVGPMMGQTNHFYKYAPQQIPYAQKRYLNESKRICEVIDKQLSTNAYIAGANYSIADMATLPWVDYFLEKHGAKLEGAQYPNAERWRAELLARPAVKSGYARSPYKTPSRPIH